MDNLEEIDIFLDTYNLPRLNQEELELNKVLELQGIRIIIESVFIKCSKSKNLGPYHFKGEFYQTNRKVNTYPSQTIPKTEEEGTLKNSLYEVTITLVSKSMIQQEKKKATNPIYLVNSDAKVLKKTRANQIQ